ncbi:cupin-like domain-containing protein [Schlesneria sp. DSM 10557]|uniref:cupin-like domain-containing protein n=1 Tax=Schlesneria sp. DSM 10557 TaxID=3044399 RepID=UPI0035A02D45
MERPPDISTTLFSRLFEIYHDQPRVTVVDRLATAPTREEFLTELLPAGLPVVYSTPTMKAVLWEEASTTLATGAADAIVHVRQAAYASPGEYITARQKESVSLVEYLDELGQSTSQNRPARYAGNVALSFRFAEAFGATPPDCVDRSYFEPPAFWLGPKGSVTPLHKDSTPNFAMQIVGRKRWILFPVRDIALLRMTRSSMDDEVDFATSSLDRNAILEFGTNSTPRIEGRPQFLEVTVEPGEILYLPAGWGHYVENLSISLMINYWIGKQHFRELVSQYL